MMSRYWIAVVSKDLTKIGAAGGFMQACHGKKAPLQRMKREDWVVFYSAKISMDGNQKCQSFTAIGQAVDDEVFQVQQFEKFEPFRRRVKFYDCADASIVPLVKDLDFIKDKKSWGYPFRYGFLEIGEADFQLISSKMLNNNTLFETIEASIKPSNFQLFPDSAFDFDLVKQKSLKTS